MLFFAVALVLPFASTVAMSPPQVMIGTCTGPGATAPTRGRDRLRKRRRLDELSLCHGRGREPGKRSRACETQ
jgi:hypothetical protein